MRSRARASARAVDSKYINALKTIQTSEEDASACLWKVPISPRQLQQDGNACCSSFVVPGQAESTPWGEGVPEDLGNPNQPCLSALPESTSSDCVNVRIALAQITLMALKICSRDQHQVTQTDGADPMSFGSWQVPLYDHRPFSRGRHDCFSVDSSHVVLATDTGTAVVGSSRFITQVVDRLGTVLHPGRYQQPYPSLLGPVH